MGVVFIEGSQDWVQVHMDLYFAPEKIQNKEQDSL
jgi:hypothetical protein